MIKSFASRDTERLFQLLRVRRFQAFARQAKRRLDVLHAAVRLDDLTRNPGNRLETLKGRRKGQHTIRINDQWRVCFSWDGQDARDAEIVDYH